MSKYLGHVVLHGDGAGGVPVVCIYSDGPTKEPASLTGAPAAFNHAKNGEAPRFQYRDWFAVNPKMIRWQVGKNLLDGKRCLELHIYKPPEAAVDFALAAAYDRLVAVMLRAGFLRSSILLRSPMDDPFPEPLPCSDALPEPMDETAYFNTAKPRIIPAPPGAGGKLLHVARR